MSKDKFNEEFKSLEECIEYGWKRRNTIDKQDSRVRFIKIVDKMLKYGSRNKSVKEIPKATLEKAWRNIMYVIVFAEENGFKPSEYNRDRFRAFSSSLAEIGFSAGNIASIFSHVKRFMRFLFDTNVIKTPFDLSSESVRIKTKNLRMTEEKKLIPSCCDIIKIRKLQIPLEVALFLELAISSGLRISELIQIRYCDLNFNDIPIDCNTGDKNKLCGGSITLNPKYIQLKGRATVKTYFSKLTLRLLKLYMRVNGVKDLNTIVRIFPYSITVIQLWFHRMNALCDFETAMNKTSDSARRSLEELSEEELEKELDGLSVNLIYNMKARIKEIKEDPLKLIRLESEVYGNRHKENLTAHSLRYFFIGLQLYKDYRGGSMDIAYIKQLIGHRSYDTIFGYILKLDMVNEIKMYTRLMAGSPGDYRKLMVKKPGVKTNLAPKEYRDVPWHQISMYNDCIKKLAEKHNIKVKGVKTGTREILKMIRELKKSKSSEVETRELNIEKNKVINEGKFDLFEE